MEINHIINAPLKYQIIRYSLFPCLLNLLARQIKINLNSENTMKA